MARFCLLSFAFLYFSHTSRFSRFTPTIFPLACSVTLNFPFTFICWCSLAFLLVFLFPPFSSLFLSDLLLSSSLAFISFFVARLLSFSLYSLVVPLSFFFASLYTLVFPLRLSLLYISACPCPALSFFTPYSLWLRSLPRTLGL